MPALDMPLPELKEYRGRDEKPEDFDAFWDHARQELRNIEADYYIEDAAFCFPHIYCGHLYFRGLSGAKIHCKFLAPADYRHRKLPVMIRFHGYQMDSGEWYEKLPYAYNDFIVLALDCRGQFGLSEDNHSTKGNTQKGHIIRGIESLDPKDLLFKYNYLDVVELVSVIKAPPFADEQRIFLFGFSQGGALAVVTAALCPDNVVTAAIGYPFLSDFRRVWELDFTGEPYSERFLCLRKKDPRHKKIEDFWRTLSYLDVKNFADKIRAEVIFFAAQREE